MEKITLTIIAAIVLMGLVVLGFLVGWLITGKSIKRGTCGMVPPEKRKKGKKTEGCSICGADRVCEKEKDDDDTPETDTSQSD